MSISAEISDEEVLAAFPAVLIDYDNVEHYRGLLQQKLLINHCQGCGYWVYPHRPLCPECWSDDVRPTEVSGCGTVYMYALLHQGAAIAGHDYADGPFPVVVVELEERKGLRYTSTVVGCRNDEIKIGMPVRLKWLERAGRTVPVFERVGEGA